MVVGQSRTLVLTKPTGMHYADFSYPELKGAIIVSGRKTIEPKIELKIEYLI
ncbi:MAG: hypothetical protein M3M91_04285 [Thermoproteota archaeon]|nr:hypothetical protein [Thermoproteota archaeon]